jgi:hypothetical protein
MPEGLILAVAFALALAAAALATPAAVALARRTSFYDHPRDYKKHAAPTHLGVAVFFGVLSRWPPCAGDSATSTPSWRSPLRYSRWNPRRSDPGEHRCAGGGRVGAAAVLFYSGIGWALFGSESRTSCSRFFSVAVVNAFNLMDNLDGATTTSRHPALAIAVFAAVQLRTAATLAVTLAGACAGFLLRSRDPGRESSSATAEHGDRRDAGRAVDEPAGPGLRLELLPVIVVLVGLLRSTAGSSSPGCAGVPVLSGGRDHLTTACSTAGVRRRVALALAGAGRSLGTGDRPLSGPGCRGGGGGHAPRFRRGGLRSQARVVP